MKSIKQNSKQNNLISKIKQFFFTNGWEPLPYQIESWEAFFNGENGIIQVPTGCGKTYAALMGPLSQIKDPKNNKSVKILLITPL
ncbi:DEAD/DEAH box helicase, partial [Prochlorococcus sp. AH-736-K20]